MECLLDLTGDAPQPEALYERIVFPDPPADRPYVYINMVSTVDGKIVVGKVGGTSKGVGGPTDQLLFRRLQQNCDAALVGGVTLRASSVIYPQALPRFTVTKSGDVPLGNRFFRDAPERAYVLAPEDLPEDAAARLAAGTNLMRIGRGEVNLPEALRRMRDEMGIRHLLCEGGATLNDALLRAGLVDELFLTLAPKLKGGATLPTIVTGQGFPPGVFLPLTLLSLYRDGEELYLRYRLEQNLEITG